MNIEKHDLLPYKNALHLKHIHITFSFRIEFQGVDKNKLVVPLRLTITGMYTVVNGKLQADVRRTSLKAVRIKNGLYIDLIDYGPIPFGPFEKLALPPQGSDYNITIKYRKDQQFEVN